MLTKAKVRVVFGMTTTPIKLSINRTRFVAWRRVYWYVQTNKLGRGMSALFMQYQDSGRICTGGQNNSGLWASLPWSIFIGGGHMPQWKKAGQSARVSFKSARKESMESILERGR